MPDQIVRVYLPFTFTNVQGDAFGVFEPIRLGHLE